MAERKPTHFVYETTKKRKNKIKFNGMLKLPMNRCYSPRAVEHSLLCLYSVVTYVYETVSTEW